jgi:opacity protein-like surface antigen
MKLLTLITAASSVTATAFAGEPAPMAPAPAPSSCWDGWFAGATYGQFDTDHNIQADDDEEYSDFDFDMFTLHVGRDLDTQFLGCDLAAYVEVGFLLGDLTYNEYDSFSSVPDFSETIDLDIIPFTINLKAERALFAGVKGYMTAGIGYAFTRLSADGDSESFGDGGFFAQASIGLAYDINENWEIFGGARWMYLSDLELGEGEGIELDDAIAWEIGLRYNF